MAVTFRPGDRSVECRFDWEGRTAPVTYQGRPTLYTTICPHCGELHWIVPAWEMDGTVEDDLAVLEVVAGIATLPEHRHEPFPILVTGWKG